MSAEHLFCEIRAEADGRRLSGVAVRYGDVASIGNVFRERFSAGAFGDVAGADVILNRQHERGTPLARTGGGGLVLTDGPDALRFVADLPETRDADDTLSLVRANILRGASVEFRAVSERMVGNVRTIDKATIRAIAVCDRGAYPQSVIEVREAMLHSAAPRRLFWL